jgi:hypothetical protein
MFWLAFTAVVEPLSAFVLATWVIIELIARR